MLQGSAHVMDRTATLTIRDHKGACLESEVGTLGELDLFLAATGYPLAIADILQGEDQARDDDGLRYFLAQ